MSNAVLFVSIINLVTISSYINVVHRMLLLALVAAQTNNFLRRNVPAGNAHTRYWFGSKITFKSFQATYIYSGQVKSSLLSIHLHTAVL